MLKRILGAVGVLVAGFALVVGLVYVELRAVVETIRAEGEERIPMYREAIRAKSLLDEITSVVQSSFLQSRASDLEATQRQAAELLAQFDRSLAILSSQRFATASAPASGSTSTSRCSTPWSR